MCGIVGLFLKDPQLEPRLGAMLTDMLVTMTDRGPDSAGIAIYAGAKDGIGKITVQSARPEVDFKTLDEDLRDAIGKPVLMLVKSTHAVLEVPIDQIEAARSALAHLRPGVKVMSAGDSIEIFKEVGLPRDVAARFGVSKMGGTHGIGHTRMATESAVTTMGAHPFSTGSDQCPGIQPYGLVDYIFVADPNPLPAATPYDFQVALGKGRYIHNDFDYGQGYWWSDYQKQVGSFYDKTWAVYYLAEAFETTVRHCYRGCRRFLGLGAAPVCGTSVHRDVRPACLLA